ncbi:MAG TPA: alpha/beta fold hydrolase [Sphingomicrobium sp.]|nr:alpha/beta fold hydrolase [Sphingomicrobium sp.]
MSEASLHRWTASDGVELAWHEVGEGRPVVLLHGLFSDAEMNWIKFGHAERIAAEGVRVIMPDLRAHGASGKPHDPANYPKGVLVRDLHELVGRLALTDFDLGGFSLGSRVTIDAVLYGMRPGRAVLSGTGLDVLTNWQRRCRFFAEAIDMFDTAPRGDPHWLAIQFMRTMKVDREAARLLLGTMDDHDDPKAAVASFAMPTLVVCGSEDHDNGSAEELARALPDARFEEVPGTHMSSVTRPELGEAIARFLAA